VLARIAAQLAAVDLVPGEIETAVLLPGKLNFLAIDLPGVDPHMDVRLLGIAVNDREGATSWEFTLQPLLSHA
jgi:hypothetical protein